MDFSTKCMCCLERESERELNSTYYQFGRGENYTNMIKECFEIELINVLGDGICEVCIVRLRDACDFKTQVQTCQRHFTGGGNEDQQEESQHEDCIIVNSPTEDNIYSETPPLIDDPRVTITVNDIQVIVEQVNEDSSSTFIIDEIKDEPANGKEDENLQTENNLNGCSYVNLEKEFVDDHLQLHEKRQYECDNCGLKLDTKSEIEKHIKTMHQHEVFIPPTVLKEVNLLNCLTCNRKFTSKQLLVKHIITHNTEKPYKSKLRSARKGKSKRKANKEKVKVLISKTGKRYACNYCNFTNIRPSIILKHEITHTGAKPYKCKHCKYRSSQISNMRVHERVHTGEKPFQCSFCDYRSTQRGTIKVHERMHTSEKPYACSFCDYRTAHGNQIKVHLRTHTGEKPYKCAYCDYKSSQNSVVKRHEKIHQMKKVLKL